MRYQLTQTLTPEFYFVEERDIQYPQEARCEVAWGAARTVVLVYGGLKHFCFVRATGEVVWEIHLVGSAEIRNQSCWCWTRLGVIVWELLGIVRVWFWFF